jgi:hypothetical protein
MASIYHDEYVASHNNIRSSSNKAAAVSCIPSHHTSHTWLRCSIVCMGGSTNVRDMEMAMATIVSNPILTLFHPLPYSQEQKIIYITQLMMIMMMML